MHEIYAVALAAMHQDMARLDRIATNLSNAATPGYKREVVAGRPFTELVSAAAAPEATAIGAVGDAQGLRVVSDVRPGTLKLTGEPFDLALEGAGYFEVQMPDGLAYTRQGNFHVDARGRLVTVEGYPVMGTSGEIVLSTQSPVIDAIGKVTEPNATGVGSVPGASVAQLRVVQFDKPDRLTRMGGGLLRPVSADPGSGLAQPKVRQGALENSNVNSMEEMVQLIQTMRHVESVQRALQGYDEILGTAIRKLGDLS